MSESQTTIGAEVSVSGTGLHGGLKTTLVFKPAEPNTGIRFTRTDLDDSPEIKVEASSVVEADDNSRRTVLRRGDVEISTVEHVLAAIRGLGLDNVRIEIDSPEAPEPDGSSAPFVEILKEAGRVRQDAARRYIEIKKPLTVSEGGVELVALPHDGLRITYTLDYDHPMIGAQHASFDLAGEEVFEREIAPARTFSLLKEVEILRERGLIKGGSLDNSVVIGDDKLMNDGPLRFPDEFVRHKILDLMGDLSLLGRPVKGHIISVKSGHATNIRMVKMIDEKYGGGNKLAGRHVRDVPSSLNIEQIMEIMPHRYPMLLVDRILELEEGKRVVGIKNVTINEPFFAGHFPGHPIMPAVLIVEAMAQTGGVLLLSMVESPKDKLVYFMAIDKAKFRKPVMPGDQVRFELELVRLKMSTCKMRGKAYVGEDLVAEAELLSVLKDRQEVDRKVLGT